MPESASFCLARHQCAEIEHLNSMTVMNLKRKEKFEFVNSLETFIPTTRKKKQSSTRENRQTSLIEPRLTETLSAKRVTQKSGQTPVK